MSRKSFLAVLLLATLAKVVLALSTYGTNDVRFYEKFAERAAAPRAVGLYEEPVAYTRADGRLHRESFWLPPFLLNLLPALLAVSNATGIGFPALLRLLSIAADAGSSLLLWQLAGPWASVIFAGSPILLLLSGFHGNTDPVILFFLLLVVWILQSSRPAWLAGMALGVGLSLKLWPAFILPVLVLWLPSWKDRALLVLAAGLVFAGLGLPHLAQEPGLVIGQMLRYQSLAGQWGLSRLLVTGVGPEAAEAFGAYGRWPVLLLCGGAALWMSRRRAGSLLGQVGLVTALFLALTPGFGIQYVSWLLPWLAALGAEFVLLYSISGGFFLFLVYNFWAGGMPWSFADSTMVGPWRDSLVLVEMLCWLTVVYLAWQFFQRERARG